MVGQERPPRSQRVVVMACDKRCIWSIGRGRILKVVCFCVSHPGFVGSVSIVTAFPLRLGKDVRGIVRTGRGVEAFAGVASVGTLSAGGFARGCPFRDPLRCFAWVLF